MPVPIIGPTTPVGIIELDESRDQTVALMPDQQQRELSYLVSGLDDDSAVKALVEATVPGFYNGLRINNYTLERLGNGLWKVKAHYGFWGGVAGKPTGFLTFNFDTGEEKVKVTQNLFGVSQYYPAPGKKEIDFKGAIEVKKSGATTKAEGVEVQVQAFKFTVSRTFGPEAAMDGNLVELLISTAWYMNSDIIQVTILGIDLTFNPGELLFQGATGSQKSGGLSVEGLQWEGEVTLKFACQRNLANVTIAGVPGISKRGWDYLWVAYEEAQDANSKVMIPSPRQVCIDQVYPEAALSPLFFGGS